MKSFRVVLVFSVLGLVNLAGVGFATALTCQGETVDSNHLGGSGNDLIQGEDDAGHDVMAGQGGADSLNGRGGSDTICGNTENDFAGELDSPSGAQDAADIINVGAGCDSAFGFRGADQIHGGDNSDAPGCGGLYGEAANDSIWGENGNDYIDGGSGTSDWADGGAGTDTCLVATTETVINCEIFA